MKKIKLALNKLNEELDQLVWLITYRTGAGAFVYKNSNFIQYKGKMLQFTGRKSLKKLLDFILQEEETFKVGDRFYVENDTGGGIVSEKYILTAYDGFVFLVNLRTGGPENRGIMISNLSNSDIFNITRDEMNQIVDNYTLWKKI